MGGASSHLLETALIRKVGSGPKAWDGTQALMQDVISELCLHIFHLALHSEDFAVFSVSQDKLGLFCVLTQSRISQVSASKLGI